MSVADQKLIDELFDKKRISYLPGIAKVLNSPVAAIFLSQLLYWNGKGRNSHGWIYKTIEEMHQETGLSRSSQETAIRLLESNKLLEKKLAGIPARRFFKIEISNVKTILASLLECNELDTSVNSSTLADIHQAKTITRQGLRSDTTQKNYTQ